MCNKFFPIKKLNYNALLIPIKYPYLIITHHLAKIDNLYLDMVLTFKPFQRGKEQNDLYTSKPCLWCFDVVIYIFMTKLYIVHSGTKNLASDRVC